MSAWLSRNSVEARLIEAIASGDLAACAPYADWLEERGEGSRAAYLRALCAKPEQEWLCALGWFTEGHHVVRVDQVARLHEVGYETLEFATGAPVLPMQTATVCCRPLSGLQPQWVIISATGTPGGASDWIVNDIKVGNRSQFRGIGRELPGDLFATPAIDRFLAFEAALPSMDVTMTITYSGLEEGGVPFRAWIIGRLLEDQSRSAVDVEPPF